MNSRLEQFVREHREEFDAEEPDKKILEKILSEVDPGKKKQSLLVRPDWRRWSAAAAVVLLIAGAVWYFNTRTAPQPNIVKTNTIPAADGGKRTTPLAQTKANDNSQTPVVDSSQAAKQPTLADIRPKDNKDEAGKGTELDNSMNEEMYHYARLVEIKHNQLKAIEKDEPLLYRQFASDVSKLDSVYHNLQNQLPQNPNREQLLEAMLQNLQLQMGLLNHQLDIIKQINHSKKTEYEKAYKTT
jgi:hypothetical protein